jgi:hypothetical protein
MEGIYSMPSDDDVKRIVEPHFPIFVASWKGAFTDYRTKYDETRMVHSKIARAILLRDHCIDHIKRNFHGVMHVEIMERGLMCLVVMSGKHLGLDLYAAARLKKFNPNMLTSNIPTKQSGNFAEQKPVVTEFQGELFGEPITEMKKEPVHLNIGYQPNHLYTDVEGVYMAMPNGKRSVKWFVKISDGKDDEGMVFSMPITSLPPVPPQESGQPKVRVKKKNS